MRRLNRQVAHMKEQSLEKLAVWLARKTKAATSQLEAAQQALEQAGVPVAYARSQWSAQVQVQCRPLPGTLVYPCYLCTV